MLRIVPRGALADQFRRYDGVAPTVTPGLTAGAFSAPAGFRGIDVSTPIPAGSHDRAVDAVLTMAVHREAGLLTAMPAPRVRVGDAVVVGVPLGPMALVVPCRVAWVSESGFGYTTLPGHPESGEEAFSVSDGRYRVFGYSRSAGIVRLGAPVARFAASRQVAA